MIGKFWNSIVSKIRLGRFALSTNVKLLTFGAIYLGSYSNYKHDPQPLIFCMYSGPKYTHGLNIHYFSHMDKAWLGNLIYMIKKGGQVIDGYTLYKLLKMRRMSIVKSCYRVYFTNLLNMKMVSAGITPLDKMIYTDHRDPWVHALNEKIKPSEIKRPPTVAFYAEELRDRVIQAQQSQNIQTQTVTSRGTRAPYQSPAPWLKS